MRAKWWASATAFGCSAAAIEYWFRRPVPTPPGTEAVQLARTGADRLPLIGVLTRLKSVITDPIGLVIRNQASYGDMFTLRVPSIYDFTFLLGSEHYQRVLSLPTDHAGVGEVLHRVPTVGYWFPRSQSGPETLQALILLGRRLMAEMLPSTSVQCVPDLVPDIAKQHTADWSDTVDLTAAIHPIVYEVTGRYFAGNELWDALGHRLTEYYRDIGDGIDIPRTTLSITPFHYLMPEYRATRKLVHLIRDEVPTFSASNSPLLHAIRDARLYGKPLTIADQSWMFMYVLWNATVYPGTYTYWTLIDILARPELTERLTSMESRPARHELLSRCLNETVRMYPVSSLIRYLDKPYEFEQNGRTYHIPAGQAIGLFPGTLNRDPKRVPGSPDTYDPDRYAREPGPTVSSFGRGPFGCIAQRFSETVTASVLDELLQQYSIQSPSQLPVRRTRVHQTYPGSSSPARITNR